MTSQAKRKPFKCNKCGMGFTLLASLQMHHLRHNGLKLFKCEMCDNKFYSTGDLNRHIKTHLGIKEFQCSHCDMQYTRKGSLKQHIQRIHLGALGDNEVYGKSREKVPCKDCGKMFHCDSLRNHRRMHTGVKPYLCLRCLSTYSDPSSIRQHMRCHVKKGQVFCRNCQDVFESQTDLEEHVAEMHGNKNHYQLYSNEEIETLRLDKKKLKSDRSNEHPKRNGSERLQKSNNSESEENIPHLWKERNRELSDCNSLAAMCVKLGNEVHEGEGKARECSEIKEKPEEQDHYPEHDALGQCTEEIWHMKEKENIVQFTNKYIKQEFVEDAVGGDAIQSSFTPFNFNEIEVKFEDIQ